MNVSQVFELVFDRIADGKNLANDIGTPVLLVGPNLEIIPSAKFSPGYDRRLIYHICYPVSTCGCDRKGCIRRAAVHA